MSSAAHTENPRFKFSESGTRSCRDAASWRGSTVTRNCDGSLTFGELCMVDRGCRQTKVGSHNQHSTTPVDGPQTITRSSSIRMKNLLAGLLGDAPRRPRDRGRSYRETAAPLKIPLPPDAHSNNEKCHHLHLPRQNGRALDHTTLVDIRGGSLAC